MATDQSIDNATQEHRRLVHFTPFADQDMNGWVLHEGATLETDYFCSVHAGSDFAQELIFSIADLPEFIIGANYLISLAARRKGGSDTDCLQIHDSRGPVISFSAVGPSWETYTGAFILKSKNNLQIFGLFQGGEGEFHVDDIRIWAID
ncbi:hypothetical protein ACJ6X8_10650 [Pseudomonas alvandae]|uniref:hypothetical protein n=1 Tax=Pseudomonas TaxID=286 RepID=UPI00389AA517